eukprot:TRINITY_DN112692_c0_g1_i1.p1 TRINITY_DN112692_c0_g1~~TRINITY_DN112692_c0_g1_i1.p1  ORF type:complete len:262 (-),score=54.45 TRINITY_DN112692_c0_g1_i1:489-1274(-)
MDENDVGGNLHKVTLRPRRPGESVKVAETVLKRRDRNLKAAADRAAQIARVKAAKKTAKKGKLNIIRAEALVKSSRTRIADGYRRKTQEKKKKPKLGAAAVVCIARNGRIGGTKEVKVALNELGLMKRHTMVFRLNNEETSKLCQTAKPFLFWGNIPFKGLFNVVHKKALFKDPSVKGKVTVLSDNTLIEKHLGDLGCLCTEDLAHVVHTGGKAFKQVTARLLPVPLGNVKTANGMVHDQYFTYGDLKEKMGAQVTKMMGD